MSARVIVHIGSTKTGSSALQATLFERRALLKEAGVLYSDVGVASGAHHLIAAAIHPGAWNLHPDALSQNDAERHRFFVAACEAMKDEAAQASASTIIVSSEYLWGAFPSATYKALRDAFAPASFEVVAFVRRPDDWVKSSYLQAVKTGGALEFSDWFGREMERWAGGLNYFRVINRWNVFLDAHKVHVLRYEDTKSNVYKAFCDAAALGVDTDIAMRRVNPSPSAQSVSRLLEINRSDRPAHEKHAERRGVMVGQNGGATNSDVMSAADLDRIATLTRRSDQLLARQFLRDGQQAFPDRPPHRDPQPSPPSESTR